MFQGYGASSLAHGLPMVFIRAVGTSKANGSVSQYTHACRCTPSHTRPWAHHHIYTRICRVSNGSSIPTRLTNLSSFPSGAYSRRENHFPSRPVGHMAYDLMAAPLRSPGIRHFGWIKDWRPYKMWSRRLLNRHLSDSEMASRQREGGGPHEAGYSRFFSRLAES